VDEMGTNVSLSALYACSRRGQRAFGSAPRNWGKNVTLLASITHWGFLGPCLAVEGSTTRGVLVFEAYLERVLAPALRPGPKWPSGGDGQPICPQGREGKGDRRGAGLRACVPAALLA
jgi:hypothetical protein